MKSIENMTIGEKYILDDFMVEIIKNSDNCQNCLLCHCNNTCFFAYDCIQHNFKNFKETD